MGIKSAVVTNLVFVTFWRCVAISALLVLKWHCLPQKPRFQQPKPTTTLRSIRKTSGATYSWLTRPDQDLLELCYSMSGSKWLVGVGILVWFVIYLSPASDPKRCGSVSQNATPGHIYTFITGCVSGAILAPVILYALKRVTAYFLLQGDEGHDSLYRLDHGILNIKMPPTSMWMNMGFWDQTTDFPAACRALLEEVLMAGGLLGADRMPLGQPTTTSIKIIDLGFGCGDQTVYLLQLAHEIRQKGCNATDLPKHRLLDSYIGLTIVESQFRFATERLHSFLSIADKSRVKLFCADAAKPSTWNRDLHKAATDTTTNGDGTHYVSKEQSCATWILALDTLYHFIPSREPIFRHAFKELDASIMAFDLLLSDEPSIWGLLLLRFVCLFAETPFSNFITVTEYRKQLVAAGYDENKIEIRDVSDHVFAGMVSFLEKQDRDLRHFGMAFGRYKMAGKIFKWWAHTGIVRGCIVVARK